MQFENVLSNSLIKCLGSDSVIERVTRWMQPIQTSLAAHQVFLSIPILLADLSICEGLESSKGINNGQPPRRPLSRSSSPRSVRGRPICMFGITCVPSWLLEGIIYSLSVSGQVIELVHSLSLTCSLLLPPSVKVCSILPSSLSHFRRIEPEDNEAGWVEDFSILAHQWLRFMIISFSCVRCPLYSLGCVPNAAIVCRVVEMLLGRRSGSLPTLDELTPPPTPLPRESLLHLRTYLFCATAEEAAAVSTSFVSLICDGLNQKLFPGTDSTYVTERTLASSPDSRFSSILLPFEIHWRRCPVLLAGCGSAGNICQIQTARALHAHRYCCRVGRSRSGEGSSAGKTWYTPSRDTHFCPYERTFNMKC